MQDSDLVSMYINAKKSTQYREIPCDIVGRCVFAWSNNQVALSAKYSYPTA